MTHLSRRRVMNRVGFLMSGLATLIGLGVLAAILWSLLSQGLHSLTLTTLTQMTPAPGSQGGLLNAIVGSLFMTGLGIAVATPVGILAGIYLSEYGGGRLSVATRFVNDVLLSAPSIIVGLFVYTVTVVPMHHFSGLAGALA
jgi:phosphate transport system permease protein